ncbi:MAG: cyclase family protein [Candidatus Handelsmanbacteria bacterium]|nr:cyclase family protein [Candidatus Handelsmanbacteria bacterium]
MAPRTIDLSHDLSPATPPFPGNPPVSVSILMAQPQGPLNASAFSTCVHTGTHLDAPFHFFSQGQTIEQLAPERCMGPAALLPLPGCREVLPAHLGPREAAIRRAGKLVLDLDWARHWGEECYFTEYPALSPAAANLLVEWGVGLLGVDTPSVDYPPNESHQTLLGNGVLILENLNGLSQVGREEFHLLALPLRLSGRDASPVRALALVED